MDKAFKKYGVRTTEDLDILADMEEYWAEVEQYLSGQGLTRFHWLVIREGLIARAAASRR